MLGSGNVFVSQSGNGRVANSSGLRSVEAASVYIYMRIRITNEHVTHLVMSRSLHVRAIYGFVVVVVVVVVVG